MIARIAAAGHFHGCIAGLSLELAVDLRI